MMMPLVVTLIVALVDWPDPPLNVAEHVPPLAAVTTRFQLGPLPLLAENVAIGVVPPHVFVCESVPV